MNNSSHKRQYAADAFLSCSLRKEDIPFIRHVASILKIHNIKPVGTVGKYFAAPENPAVSMRKNIPKCDLVVIVATPRYFQKDLKTGQASYALSEQIHVESGIAYAHGKPLIVFTREGTDVGGFIPSVTQYITLNGAKRDYLKKRHLIFNLLKNACLRVQQQRTIRNQANIGNFVVGTLAFYGGYKALEYILKDEP